MLPKKTQCRNLLVSVAASASHIAFSALRMEPHWMAMGTACGVAASLSINEHYDLHELSPNTSQAVWYAKSDR